MTLGVVYTPREVAEPMVRLALAPYRGKRVRVCDFACGDGAFLRAARDVIAEWLPLDEAARCLTGIDIDEAALAKVQIAGATLIHGDALAMDHPHYDVVVGNPPYIRQEKLSKDALRGYAAFDGVADLYVYFLELAQRIADRWCVIVPSKWMTAAYGRKLRGLLRVEGLVDFTRAPPLFGDADAFPCIVWGPGEPTAARVEDATPVAQALAQPRQPQAWTDEPWYVDTPAERALLDKLAKHPRLALTPSRGAVTGCNKAFVVDRATAERLDAPSLIRPFAKGRDIRRFAMAPIDRYLIAVDRGVEPPPRVLAHLAQFRAELEPGTGRKPGAYKWYELQDPLGAVAKSRAPRLMYQDIQTSPAACIAADVIPDTTVWMLPTDDAFLLALLNSQLYGWYARRRFPPALNGAVRPKLEYMMRLPIAHGDARTDDEICDLYELTRAERELIRT